MSRKRMIWYNSLMQARYDLTGQRFGKLLVVRCVGSAKDRGLRWECQCDCGSTCITTAKVLRSGESQSCGCYNRERTVQSHTKHGLAKTPTYKSYVTMLDRCHNPDHASYSRYGALGITVCNEWRESVTAFIRDVGPRPSRDHSLDRIDPTKGYEPGNCRWATRSEQQQNRRDTIKLTFKDQTLPLPEWAKRFQLPLNTLHRRIDLGWTVEKALTTPIKPLGRTSQRPPP
jgi:hypothetical protein